MPTPTEEIKQRIDIVEYIGESVQLKAAGSNWKGKCPFHNERTPSFMVSRDRGTWHCFGCGRGGDIFSFVQEQDGLDFPEALRLLAKRAGVELKSFDPKLQTQRTKILDALRWTTKWYQENLKKSKEAEPVRAYLRERGLTDQTIETWQIGYAPKQLTATAQALKQKGVSDDDAFQAGLTLKNDRGAGYIDRFRGRIMFPLHDPHGTVIGFSGRIFEPNLDPSRPVPPKYINSPQTAVYHKSLHLFGLDKAKAAIKQAKKVVLVEGQMDCIASHQAGVANVVATGGTALTRDHVTYLKRFTNTLVFAFDQDTAGAQAVLRGVDQALQAGVDVLVVTLPSGKDPDELIRHDRAAWEQAIASAAPVMDYFFTQSTHDRDLQNIQVKKEVARELLPIVAKLSDPIEQAHYLERLAQLVGVEASNLRSSLPSGAPGTTARRPSPPPAPMARPDRAQAISERLLAMLVQSPGFLKQTAGNLAPELLAGDQLQRLYKTVMIWYTERHVESREDIERLVSTVEPEQQELFTLLFLLADKEFPDDSDLNREQEYVSMVTSLKRRSLARRLRQLESAIRQLEQQPDQTGQPLADLLNEFQQLTRQLRELS